MNMRELSNQACGLERTAENMIKGGQGEKPVASIVRQAAQILLQTARQLNGGKPPFHPPNLYPGMTWNEISAIATATCNYTKESPLEEPAAALKKHQG